MKKFETSPAQRSPEQITIKRHQDKLIGYYLSDGDDGFIFNSNQPNYDSAKITDGEREAVLNKLQADPNTYRKIERRLLNEIARSRSPETPDNIFSKISADKHQKKILAYMTGVSWNNLDKLNSRNVAKFLTEFPNPLDFEKTSLEFLGKINENNTLEKYREYQTSMDDFCRQMYGKKYEYYEAMKDLRREAFGRNSERRTRLQETGKRSLRAIFNGRNKEQNKPESLVLDAGIATINKGELTGNPNRLNEDSWYSDPESGLFGVFDGAGGERGGARASRLAMATMQQMAHSQEINAPQDLAEIMFTMNEALLNDFASGYSTAVLGKILEKDGRKRLAYASVGDSRIYLVRKNTAIQLTKDEGEGNFIYNSLGDKDMYLRQIREVELQKGDRILFCSDGITGDYEKDFIPNEELGSIIGHAKSAKQAASGIAQRATKKDDRTALVVEV